MPFHYENTDYLQYMWVWDNTNGIYVSATQPPY